MESNTSVHLREGGLCLLSRSHIDHVLNIIGGIFVLFTSVFRDFDLTLHIVMGIPVVLAEGALLLLLCRLVKTLSGCSGRHVRDHFLHVGVGVLLGLRGFTVLSNRLKIDI